MSNKRDGITDLAPLIEQAKAGSHSHVVVFMGGEGIHWRPESEEACNVMAKIIGGDCKVMSRQKFIEDLESVQVENFGRA